MSDTPPPADAAPVVTATPPAPRTKFAWPWAVALALGCGVVYLTFEAVAGRAESTPPIESQSKKNLDIAPLKTSEPVAFRADDKDKDKKDEKKKVAAPELEGGSAWLNSGGPLTLKKDLKGKIVILDFWTLCCINCIHIMPDLAKLEKKYPNELVVIGVHSPKFENEKATASIRKAVLRYQIEHPVINDADHAIWNKYEVEAWPTLVVIDPEGNLVGYASGEGNYEILDTVISKLIDEHKKKKTLNEKPIRFDLARFRESGDTPLFFPGKVVADEKGKRLFIADSTHHRLVVTDLEGNKIAVIGTGTPGKTDGAFDKAQFDDPQGMVVRGDTVFVADRKNHLIREVDLKAKTVTTIAGTGDQDHEVDNRRLTSAVPAKQVGLNSPWDLALDGDKLYIAMAGHHQIWLLDLKEKSLAPYAGNGRETIGDGALRRAMFAQPSGLVSDGKNLFVADSEISALRKVPLDPEGKVETLVGRGLFTFGDVDGPGQVADDPLMMKTEARLQHALGVTYADGKLFVADTYNSKIKVFDLKTGDLKTFVGGNPIGWFGPTTFNEPAGISFAGGKLFVADTNAHRIRVVDVATKAVTTLQLKGVEPPAVAREIKSDEPKK
ncbi:thiol-disulfide isomerase-like thioredoxin : NHL repeat containing protein OS=Planctomyces limnophilus (strain ATCC 43296 / DSM 3776 / IFAM 1008 / 290) GN=Plim_4099 PE=4 SV=1: Thioredoxin_8 [Gemmata massiliana]|uniref:Thioredoxin domain-containing protein n=1 Tax=Gemmata massiliana TaxID=1210884 RepID=A0A6P2DHN7_9BACT|nr:thioredoxin-like domain-containing protein [Gemmata massiliana]VTS02391.1 thiol-disulfide isomerase-like thioredoxin : NHL repeat containing protein OS=Planctomyces limnophilus (strain ATCC 43296 / DSM 3776 / IFAM 1008 / 290) GN=Plim_4099 PE=4 SV=1: Thioredoxin_8 [Gemmata massiliana]